SSGSREISPERFAALTLRSEPSSAARAAAVARSTSSGPPSATSQIASPVAGSIVSKVRPSAASSRSPPITRRFGPPSTNSRAAGERDWAVAVAIAGIVDGARPRALTSAEAAALPARLLAAVAVDRRRAVGALRRGGRRRLALCLDRGGVAAQGRGLGVRAARIRARARVGGGAARIRRRGGRRGRRHALGGRRRRGRRRLLGIGRGRAGGAV